MKKQTVGRFPNDAEVLLLALLLALSRCLVAAPSCQNVTIQLIQDYTEIVGNVDYYDAAAVEQYQSSYCWIINGVAGTEQTVSELLLLQFDGTSVGAAYDLPESSNGVGYGTGRWGQALELQTGGKILYPRSKNLNLDEGTIEMWVAPRANGDNPIYTSRWHPLFYYSSGNDWMAVVQGNNGVIYAGGSVNGQWQSAYNSAASTRGWSAGQWHHVVYTYSKSQNFMRFYLDGQLTADTNEHHYWSPAAGSTTFVIGADKGGANAYYSIDAVRILGRAADSDEVAVWANRTEAPKAFEARLDSVGLTANSLISFQFTPSNGSQTGASCQSISLVWPGIPLKDPYPVSTLLLPNTTQLPFSVTSIVPTQCRYSIGTALPYEQMMPFNAGAGTTFHQTTLVGLNTDPNRVNEVYVRCADYPDFALHLRYRCLSAANPSFPRTGNLWGSGTLLAKGLDYCSRIDLWLGASFSAEQIRQLRKKNPDVQVLTSINAVENHGLDESYYLKDIYGNKVETWPGSYRLNLTKPEVAEYQAYYAYQRILDSDMMYDGCFFDNVMTTQSWQNHDIYGNPFLADADEDGVADDPQVFDAAWKAGVFHELQTFRNLMPYALLSGHSMDIFEPGISDLANGVSIGFGTADVLEGEKDFDWLWNRYTAWQTQAVAPPITMVESSPIDQIAYGYGYSPKNTIPASTLDFAQHYYPEMRFGLALTLMQDGFFAHEFGDTWHGNDWWYDELDYDLGYPLGQAEFIGVSQTPPVNLIQNPGFESSLTGTWSLWANTSQGCVATLVRDTAQKVTGSYSAKITISQTSLVNWHIEVSQPNRTLVKDKRYTLSFWARSDVERLITVSAQKGSPDWNNYGLNQNVAIGPEWKQYTVSFTANADTSQSRIQFLVGQVIGTVWIDDVCLAEAAPQVMRRKFTRGLVLLNTSRETISYDVGFGYRRLSGSQAPRYEYIVDNTDARFSTAGMWSQAVYDSGEWKASGPYYHNWGADCQQTAAASATARWNLTIPQSDIYTITAWWPAAPSLAGTAASNVLFEVVANEIVVASAVYDQRTGGDQWHWVASVALTPQDNAYVRLTSPGSGICIADAIHVRSSLRYNDGTPCAMVTLAPMDGIVLEWTGRFGDFNADGIVDLLDFALISQHWLSGQVLESLDIAPVGGDHAINLAELQVLAENWLNSGVEPVYP